MYFAIYYYYVLVSELLETVPGPDILHHDVSRRLWFPLTVDVNPEVAREVFLSTRQNPVHLQGSDIQLSGPKLLAAEALHGLVDLPTAARSIALLGLPEAVVYSASKVVLPAANALADLVIAKTHELEIIPGLHGLRRKIQRDPVRRVLLAEKIIAANAHFGETRFNGLPYDTHVTAAEAIVRRASKDPFRGNPEERILLRAGALSHDTYEHAFPKQIGSPLGTPRFLGSPLVRCALLTRLGISGNEALRMARSQLLMTHTVPMSVIGALRKAAGDPVLPGSKEYERVKDAEYKAGIAEIALFPRTALKKRADTKHNADFDPKYTPISKEDEESYIKWLAKLGVYEWSANHIDEQSKTWPVSCSAYVTALRIIDTMQAESIERQILSANRLSPFERDDMIIPKTLWLPGA